MALDEPSPSLIHLQARQRLAWAAAMHPRLSTDSLLVRGGALTPALHTRIGQHPPVLQGHTQHSDDEPQLNVRTSTTRGVGQGDTRGVEAWHVARAARSLHSLPLCSAVDSDPVWTREYRRIADRLAARLMGWHAHFSGLASSAHFFNKTSFLHEMEEVLLPLRVLVAMCSTLPPHIYQRQQLEHEPEPQPQPEPERIVVVDLCAGKGFLPMCLLHGAVPNGSDCREATVSGVEISRVLLLEKARVNWAHLRNSKCWQGAPDVEIWGPPREKLNIFDESLLGRLAAVPGKLLLVGIHLCRYRLFGPASIFDRLYDRDARCTLFLRLPRFCVQEAIESCHRDFQPVRSTEDSWIGGSNKHKLFCPPDTQQSMIVHNNFASYGIILSGL